MTSLHNFDTFAKEYLFEFELINKTPISIGAGRDPNGIVDNPIVKLSINGKKLPYIPGSSLKGILRTEAERYARTFFKDKPQYEIACDIFLKDTDPYSEKKRKKCDGDNYKPCLICQIFGGSTLASRVKVYNAEIIDGNNDKLVESIRRVTIDRITGAQYPGRLFDMEYLIPHLRFKWFLRFENVELLKDDMDDEYEKNVIKIIDYLIKRIIIRGIEVGGKKSIGLGLLEVDNFTLTEYHINEDDGMLVENDVTNKYRSRLGL